MIEKIKNKIDIVDLFIVNFFSLDEFKKRGIIAIYSILLINIFVYIYNLYKLKNEFIYLKSINLASLFVIVVSTFSIYFLIKKKYGLSFLSFLILFLISIFPNYILSSSYLSGFKFAEIYIFFSTLIFILAWHSRIKLLIIFFCLTYFFLSIPKFTSEFWLIGLTQGLPFMNNSILPFAQNAVILSQIVLPFFLVFGNRWSRIFSLLIFEIFHLYTTLIYSVQYWYLVILGPIMFFLFYEFYERPDSKIFHKNFLAMFLILLFSILSVFRLVIPGDDSITHEGSNFSLNMFNVSYRTYFEYQNKDLELIKNSDNMPSSYYNYKYILEKIKVNCVDNRDRSLKVTLSTFYNSYEVINQKNYCNLQYNPIWHNKWIGNDVKYSEDLSKLSDTQRFFHSIKNYLQFFYTTLFIFMFILMIYSFIGKKQNNFPQN